MKKTMRKAARILVTIFLMLSVYHPIYAQETDLSITLETDPLFSEDDFLPGDSSSKSVTVTNLNTTDSYVFGIATFDEVDDDNFASQLGLIITDDLGRTLYGGAGDPKTLADLFDETEFSTSAAIPGSEITLFTLAPLETRIVTLTVSFPEDSGNEWQLAETVFSFGIGFTGVILGEEEAPPTIPEVVEEIGEVLGATGQNILPIMGGSLFLISAGMVKFIKNKKDKRKVQQPTRTFGNVK